MQSETLKKLDLFRRNPERQEKENKEVFTLISLKCEHRQDNSGRHGMYAQIPACKASGIRTLQACAITTCPAIH